jgi:hypothetical protein
MFPFRVPGPARAVGCPSPCSLLPLVQFTHPSESLGGRGIVVSVQRSPLGLRRDDGTLGVFPRPPANSRLATTLRPSRGLRSAPGCFPNRTADLARSYPPGSRRTLEARSLGHSRGVSRPYSASNAGSDLHRDCLARLCNAYGLSQTLDALLRPAPCRPCFMPTTLMGFPLQRFPLPVDRAISRPRLPLSTSADRHRCANATTSILASHRWQAPPSSGVRVPQGIRSSGQGGLATWLEPILSWVFISPGFSPRPPWRPRRGPSSHVLRPDAHRSSRQVGTPESSVAAGLAGLLRGCRPS